MIPRLDTRFLAQAKDNTPELSDWEKLYNWIPKLLGHTIPPVISQLIGGAVLIVLLLIIVTAGFVSLGLITDICRTKLKPLFYDEDKKRNAGRRKIFAGHLVNELRTRNRAESWRDDEFAELEAEVEAEGSRKALTSLTFRKAPQTGIWRAKSLAKALRRSTERLILLEGDPGSGKSVTLRHVALKIAEKASTSRSADSLLPIYVNLKEIKRSAEQPVDKQLIERFILDSLNRVNDSAVTRFLDDTFKEGIETGIWLFLFDSFDEIPEILSSTEVDESIAAYSTAINAFLSGFNICRGIVASRNYRGPASLGWRKFRIVELSQERQLELIRRTHLPTPQAAALANELTTATDEIRSLARNPMLLGLLCEHMLDRGKFPQTSHEVFADYLNSRLHRDETSVAQRFGLDKETVVSGAERVAFALAVDSRLGLSPTRKDLKIALSISSNSAGALQLDKILDALEYMKLGRADREVSGDSRQFTFSHRRFQEYFATTVVIRDLNTISPRRLLLDARWRETAVTLLQLGSQTEIALILDEAEHLLAKYQTAILQAPSSPQDPFKWPPGLYHLLELLQAGLATRPTLLKGKVSDAISKILVSASSSPWLDDKKLALEIAGVANQETLLKVIEDALNIGSAWLDNSAFLQVSRLASPPPFIHGRIRAILRRMVKSGQLYRDYDTVRAYISRFRSPQLFLDLARAGHHLRRLDATASFLAAAGIYILVYKSHPYWGLLIFPAIFFLFRLYWVLPPFWALTSRAYPIAACLLVIISSKLPATNFQISVSTKCVFGLQTYLLSWIIPATAAIARGPFWKPGLLPFAHLTFVWLLYETPPSLRQLTKLAAFISGLGMAAILLSLANIPEKIWLIVFSLPPLAVTIFSFPTTFAAFFRFSQSYSNDKKLFRAVNWTGELSFSDWHATYINMSTAYWRLRALQNFRDKVHPTITPSQEKILRCLVPNIGAKPGSERDALDPILIWSPRAKRILKGDRDELGFSLCDLSRTFFGAGKAELRDELYRLVEASRKSRLDSEAQPNELELFN